MEGWRYDGRTGQWQGNHNIDVFEEDSTLKIKTVATYARAILSGIEAARAPGEPLAGLEILPDWYDMREIIEISAWATSTTRLGSLDVECWKEAVLLARRAYDAKREQAIQDRDREAERAEWGSEDL